MVISYLKYTQFNVKIVSALMFQPWFKSSSALCGRFLLSCYNSTTSLPSRCSLWPDSATTTTSLLVQGHRSGFQMMGSNFYAITLIQSKPFQFAFFHESLQKIDGCNQGFLQIDGSNNSRCTLSNGAPVTHAAYSVMYMSSPVVVDLLLLPATTHAFV